MSDIQLLKDDEVLYFLNNELSNDDYHKETAHISGTSLWEIYQTCGAKWKYKQEKEKQSRALVFGTAAHANHLEPEVFDREYFRMPEKSDFITRDEKGEIVENELFITSMEGAKAFLKKHGVSGYSKMKEAELIETVANTADALNIEGVTFWHDVVARAEKERGDREAVRGQDFDIIKEMRQTLFNDDVFKYYFVDGTHEISIFFSFMGVRIKVRLDWVSPHADLADYKTTDSGNPERFTRKCFDLGYPLKMALQREGFKAAFKRAPRKVSLITQEKESPYLVTPFDLSSKTLLIGYAQLREALAMYKYAMESGIWSGYNGGNVVDLDPPFYIERLYEHLWKGEKTSK